MRSQVQIDGQWFDVYEENEDVVVIINDRCTLVLLNKETVTDHRTVVAN